jgi:hypothetical protein
MRGVSKPLLALAAVVLLAFALGACGSGSDDSTATTSAQETTATTPSAGSETSSPSDETKGEGESQESSGSGGSDDSSSGSDEASAEFRTPGGDNSIQNYGEEADESELEAADTALSEFLAARAKGDWDGMCAALAKAAVEPIEDLAARAPQFKGSGCAAVLETFLSSSPASSRANTLTDGIASFRVEGDRGFALYHGPKGVDYFVSMVKEDGEWKVGSLATSEFP